MALFNASRKVTSRFRRRSDTVSRQGVARLWGGMGRLDEILCTLKVNRLRVGCTGMELHSELVPHVQESVGPMGPELLTGQGLWEWASAPESGGDSADRSGTTTLKIDAHEVGWCFLPSCIST